MSRNLRYLKGGYIPEYYVMGDTRSLEIAEIGVYGL